MIEWYDLNARHEATVLWVGGFVIWAIVTSEAVRESIRHLLSSFIRPILLVPILGLFIIVTGLAAVAVTFGRTVGLWEICPVVSVAVWGVTSGVGILLNYGNFLQKEGEFRRAAKVLTPAWFITTLMNIATLPIWWEIGLVPVLAILWIIDVYYASRIGYQQVSRVARTLLAVSTIALVSLAIKNIIVDPTTWKALAQGALLPIWLTIGALPYIRLLMFIERWRVLFRCPSKTIRSTDYGQDWPLVVDSAKLCAKHGAVWVEVNRKKYGVNGWSKTLLRGWGHTCLDLEEIWKDHPSVEGLKISPHRLIQDGQALECR